MAQQATGAEKLTPHGRIFPKAGRSALRRPPASQPYANFSDCSRR